MSGLPLEVAERLLRESFAATGQMPSLELMDRVTYETIRRLMETGVLKSDKRDIRQFHCSPILSPATPARKGFHKEAQDVFALAERKMRMGTVLADGGFPVEALSSVQEAVELALKASAYLAGEDVSGAGDEPISLAFVETRLVQDQFLPDDALNTVARIRDSSQPSAPVDEGAAQSLIQGCRGLVDHVNHEILKS
ncbi:MAG: hypothetical protein AB1512_17870 [Thermodesulfobacteriota bacterium]